MKCENIRADFVEALLNGPVAASPSVQEHLQECDACAEEFASLQHTMALLDEWQAPEPSPYFSSRLRARYAKRARLPAGVGCLGCVSRRWQLRLQV